MRLFVYGTLRQGGRLHNQLQQAKFLGRAEATGTLFHTPSKRYPGAVFDSDVNTRIIGELYEFPDELLSALDIVEGYYPNLPLRDSLFIRTRVLLEDSTSAESYQYNRPTADLEPIPGGDYAPWLR